MVQFAWNLSRGGNDKNYQVLYPVENPPKVNCTEPYRAIPCSGKVALISCEAALQQVVMLKVLYK